MEHYLDMFPPPTDFNKDSGSDSSERVSPKRAPVDGSIDLHGLTQDAAKTAVLQFIDDAQANGFSKVLIIHGKGLHENSEAALKKMVGDVLERHPSVGATGIPDAKHGGSGARWAIIRPNRKG